MNAILKPKKLETIFDHQVTEDELKKLLYGDTESFEEYTQFLDQDASYADISRLFRIRGNNQTALKYISLIKNEQLKMQFMTVPCTTTWNAFAEP